MLPEEVENSIAKYLLKCVYLIHDAGSIIGHNELTRSALEIID